MVPIDSKSDQQTFVWVVSLVKRVRSKEMHHLYYILIALQHNIDNCSYV